jgi:hypothetical protein
LPVSWKLQETPPFGSTFINSMEFVKSVAAFCCYRTHLSDHRAKQILLLIYGKTEPRSLQESLRKRFEVLEVFVVPTGSFP